MTDNERAMIESVRAEINAILDRALENFMTESEAIVAAQDEPTVVEAATPVVEAEPVVIPPTPAEALSAQIATLDAKVSEIALLDQDDKDRYRFGTEVHGKTRKAKRELDDLDPADPQTEAVKVQLRALTARLLHEIFGVDPGADSIAS